MSCSQLSSCLHDRLMIAPRQVHHCEMQRLPVLAGIYCSVRLQDQKRTGPEDGLDDLLAGLEGLDATPHNQGGTSDLSVSEDSDDDNMSDGDIAGDEGAHVQSTDAESREGCLLDESEELSDGEASGDGTFSEPEAEDDPLSAAGQDAPDGVADGSDLDSALPCSDDTGTTERKQRGTAASNAPAGRYERPALLKRTAGTQSGEASIAADAPQAHAQALAAVRRQIRSLLNRVASANLGAVAQQLANIFAEVPRHLVIDAIVSSTMQVCIAAFCR
jgi:hypothetical protein